MEPLDEARCRRILEVPAEASLEDIGHAYHLLKRIYASGQAPFTAPSMDEFSEEARCRALEEIEAAYRELCRFHEEAHHQAHAAPARRVDASAPLDGPALRRAREAAGLSLAAVAAETHVKAEFLSALEEERFGDLPLAAVNVRGFLVAYLTEIGLPEDPVVSAYMRRYQLWQERRR